MSQNKVAVITGANSGIGLEAAVILAKQGVAVVMCCRSVDKAKSARLDVIQRSGVDEKQIIVVQLDLADLDNIKTFRARYDVAVGRPVDMLILNAGIMALNQREVTKQGIEAQMGTNVVGHFAFAAEMIDLCKQAPSCRIVVVSSTMHNPASGIDFSDFNREKNYAKWTVYSETKLGNLLFVEKLNRIFKEKGIKNMMAVGCHPGYSATNLQAQTIAAYFNYFFAQSAERGALPTVLAATDPAAVPGGYAGPNGLGEIWGAKAKWGCVKNKLVDDLKLQDDLWAKCEELTQANFESKI